MENTQSPLTPEQIFARMAAGKPVHYLGQRYTPVGVREPENKDNAPALWALRKESLFRRSGDYQFPAFDTTAILPPYPPEIICNVCGWQGCAEQLEADNSSANHDYQRRNVCPTCGNDPHGGDQV